jgi:hypothetical protein
MADATTTDPKRLADIGEIWLEKKGWKLDWALMGQAHQRAMDDITFLLAEVTALHAERDRLKAEAVRLRAALEEIANMDRVDGEEGQPMHTAAAALASSGTVPDRPKNGQD